MRSSTRSASPSPTPAAPSPRRSEHARVKPTKGALREGTLKFDHLGIPVSDWTAAREWYVNVLGLRVEFEISDRGVVALQDDHDFAVLFHQGAVPTDPAA